MTPIDVTHQPLTPVAKKSRVATATASPVLRTLTGRISRAHKGPRPGTPLKRGVGVRTCRVVDKENVCDNGGAASTQTVMATEVPLACSPVAAVCQDRDRSIKDISQISHFTRASFREQPSTADFSGNFHSTFNYPLHSTLNYPLSSTINMEGPGEGLEVTMVEEDRTVTQPPCAPHTSRSSRSSLGQRSSGQSGHRVGRSRTSSSTVRSSSRNLRPCTTPSRLREHTGESEVDCDCDSSVLSDLVDDITLDQLHNESRSGTPTLTSDLCRQRGLRRQTGQAVLSENVRPPVALSRSDFVELDSTLQPQFEMTQVEMSMEATRGSLPDLGDLSAMSTHRVPERQTRRSRHYPAGASTRPHHTDYSQSSQSQHSCCTRSASRRRDNALSLRPPHGARLPPCGQESDRDSGVSSSARSAPCAAANRRTVSADSLQNHNKRALAKKLKRFGSSFNSADNKPKLKIKTLGVF